jgi:hypothetical protein
MARADGGRERLRRGITLVDEDFGCEWCACVSSSMMWIENRNRVVLACSPAIYTGLRNRYLGDESAALVVFAALLCHFQPRHHDGSWEEELVAQTERCVASACCGDDLSGVCRRSCCVLS